MQMNVWVFFFISGENTLLHFSYETRAFLELSENIGWDDKGGSNHVLHGAAYWYIDMFSITTKTRMKIEILILDSR